MKQLARRASLVVVLLLASVGTASAECAWGWWEDRWWENSGQRDIEPHDAFKTKKE